jgi:DNA-binding response OmpR family regulator
MRGLEGKTVLVVEDNTLIAMDLAAVLQEAGCTVIGPCSRIAKALEDMADKKIDVALLDVNLGGEKVFPLMDSLLAAGVPCLIVTGYSRDSIPAQYGKVPILLKPHQRDELLGSLNQLLRSQRAKVGPRRRAGPPMPKPMAKNATRKSR